MDLEILKIASDTSNVKKLDKYTHSSMKKNPMCGDYIIVKININNKIIKDIGYESKSCIYCQASASLFCKHLINSKLISTKNIFKEIFKFYEDENYIVKSTLLKIFNKKNYKRKECIYLPVKAIFNALKLKI